jgi:hypothetical protein
MVIFCKYKNALGEPNKGIHSYRFRGLAVADVTLTIIGAYLLSRMLNTPYLFTLLAFFVAGIILHRLFCVSTTIDKILFS